MQFHARGARYRGRKISLRSQPKMGGTAQVWLFTGSYRIARADGKIAAWHDVADFLFHTPETATAYALVEARRAIDMRLGPIEA